ncbi:unnamed protein product [Chrysoparadoxa australica]
MRRALAAVAWGCACLRPSAGFASVPSSPSLQKPAGTLAKEELPSSCVHLVDPRSGANIYLLGCLHGAPSSADEVQQLVSALQPDAVVLELCKDRLQALRKDIETAAADKEIRGMARVSLASQRWWNGVKSSYKRRGIKYSLLTAFLSSAYMVQKLTDFDPGLEFKTALTAAEGVPECRLVMGDRDVGITISRLGDEALGSFSWETMQLDWELFKYALFGDGDQSKKNGVHVPRVILSKARDLAGLVGPSSLVVTALAESLQLGFNSAFAEVAEGAPSGMEFAIGSLGEVALTGVILYSSLRFFRLVIKERDEYLAKSVQDACMVAAAAGSSGADQLDTASASSRSVVAVLGLLHVNGVQRLLCTGAKI